MTFHQLGVTRACGLIGISWSLYRATSIRPDDAALTERLTALWLPPPTYAVVPGRLAHQSKAQTDAGMERLEKVIVSAPNQSWSMDFVSDGFVDGRRLRCLNIVDDFTKECLAIEVDMSLPA